MKVVNRIKGNSGFTIIELAVVVMITSILASLAIVQFRKFRAKSYTVEAKITLANVYSLEKIFESSVNFYTNCLDFIDFKRAGTTNDFLYAIGFPNTIAAINDDIYNNADKNFFNANLCSQTLAPEENKSYFLSTVTGSKSANINDFALMAQFDELGTQESYVEKTYIATAGAMLPSGLFEVWKESVFTIDQSKRISEEKKGY